MSFPSTPSYPCVERDEVRGCKIVGTKTSNDVSMLLAGGWSPGGVWRLNDDFYELAGVGSDSLVENLLIINLIIPGFYLHKMSSDNSSV